MEPGGTDVRRVRAGRRGPPGDRPVTPAVDWTQGSIVGNLLKLSWPMVVSNLLMMLGPTIDMVWVGRLGAASIAGVGVAGIAVQLIMGAMMGLIMGMRAMVARFIGGGDVPAANHVAQQAFVISAAFAALAAVIGLFFSEAIMDLFGLEEDVVREGGSYLRVMFMGAAAMAFRVMTEGVMQASGDAVTPMVLAVFYRLLHVGLCPFLIFGWWVFPELGVQGAAVTNVVSQSLAVVVAMWFLFDGRSILFRRRGLLPLPAFGQSRLKLTMKDFRLDPSIIWRIVRIGLPAMVSGIQRTLSHFFLMYFMVPFGTVAVAAHSLIQRLEMMLFMPGMAFGSASGVLVGQNLGAGQPRRAEKSAWLAAGMVGGIVVVFSLVLLFFSESVVRIFSQEPELVSQGGVFLRIAVAGYIALPLTSVFMNSLSGAGDTLPPMIIGVATVWLVQLPMAYFLPRLTDLGVYGVRWAIVAGMIAASIGYTTYFSTGRWKRKQV